MGWEAVLQAVLVAMATWYVRRGSTQDAKRVESVTASQATAHDILTRVKALESDIALLKRALASQATIDHRGPRRG